MKKRNGFTLIELLAVIVILAIIALIAVPIILNIIGDAKSSSNERSIELYADAVEKSVATYQLNNNEKISGTFTTEDGKTLTSGTTTLKVDYKGKVEAGAMKSELKTDYSTLALRMLANAGYLYRGNPINQNMGMTLTWGD